LRRQIFLATNGSFAQEIEIAGVANLRLDKKAVHECSWTASGELLGLA
jgi:hypothetical protein